MHWLKQGISVDVVLEHSDHYGTSWFTVFMAVGENYPLVYIVLYVYECQEEVMTWHFKYHVRNSHHKRTWQHQHFKYCNEYLYQEMISTSFSIGKINQWPVTVPTCTRCTYHANSEAQFSNSILSHCIENVVITFY